MCARQLQNGRGGGAHVRDGLARRLLEPNTLRTSSPTFAPWRVDGKIDGSRRSRGGSRGASRCVGRRAPPVSSDDRAPSMLELLEPPFAPGHWVPNSRLWPEARPRSGARASRRPDQRAAIRDYAPEIIVLIPCGYYKEDVHPRSAPRCASAGRLARTPRRQKREVWTLDATSYFSRPGPRVVDGSDPSLPFFHPRILRCVPDVRTPSGSKQTR